MTDNGTGGPRVRATVCILTYGDYLDLYRRCLCSLLGHTPCDQIELRLGFNQAPGSYHYALGKLLLGWRGPAVERSADGVERGTFQTGSGMLVRTWNSPANLYKEPMSRLMYHDEPLNTEYVVWFDDDSFVEAGWWEGLCQVFDRGIDYVGQPWWVTYLPGQTEMIRSQPWYREIPFASRDGKEGTSFMTGGFLALRCDRLLQANFPDTDFSWKGDKLKQYGGDTLLGEIARQLGWSQATHDKFIKVNVDLEGKHPAPRRGGTGRQFGSDLDVVIK
jgi:hypothetical protein